jgi:hypothetical protein
MRFVARFGHQDVQRQRRQVVRHRIDIELTLHAHDLDVVMALVARFGLHRRLRRILHRTIRGQRLE